MRLFAGLGRILWVVAGFAGLKNRWMTKEFPKGERMNGA
jgi:hypothetical protein